MMILKMKIQMSSNFCSFEFYDISEKYIPMFDRRKLKGRSVFILRAVKNIVPKSISALSIFKHPEEVKNSQSLYVNRVYPKKVKFAEICPVRTDHEFGSK